LYPVGSIYTNATVSTNPATLLGFGTWTAFGAGQVMVGLDSGDATFSTLGNTGGSKDAIVVSHTHTATSTVTDSGHTHSYQYSGNAQSNGGALGVASATLQTATTASATTGITVATSNASTGSSGTNANLMPYVVVYCWKRTA
jgi:hypothetical protein